MDLGDLGARWREDLAAWAIPEEILARAPQDPWGHDVGRFARRTEALPAAPDGPTQARAREALPPGGSVLDVGAGTGAASLPLRPARLVAVDESAAMLDALAARAAELGVRAELVTGRWPDVAPRVPAADVALSAHVVYNVPDLPEFLTALTGRARRRVVLELSERHPMSRLNPLWEHFHGLRRPSRPTYRDVLEIAAALGYRVHAAYHRAPDARYASLDELARSACRRLCLDPARAGEVARVAADLGLHPGEREPWITLWWDVTPDKE